MSTIRDVRKALAADFPGVEFAVQPGRRGVRYITWTGGPARAAVGSLLSRFYRMKLQAARQNTAEEQAAEDAARDLDPGVWGSTAWIADTANREARAAALKARNRADGAKQAAETRAAIKTLRDAIAPRFKGHPFAVTRCGRGFEIRWEDGPSEAAILNGIHTTETVRVSRDESWDTRIARLAAEREASEARKAAEEERARRQRAVLQRLMSGQRVIVLPRRRTRPAPLQANLPMPLPRDISRIGGLCPLAKRFGG